VTAVYVCDFELTGPAGTGLTTANTGAIAQSIGSGGSQVSTASGVGGGALAGLFSVNATNIASRLQWQLVGGTTQFAIQYKFTIPTGFAITKRIGSLVNTAVGTLLSINYNGSTNQFQIQDAAGTTTVTCTITGGAIPGTTYRLDLVCTIATSTTGVFTLNIYNNNGTTPVQATVPITRTNYNMGTAAIDTIYGGIISNGTTVAADVIVDSIRFDAGGTTEIGPEPMLRSITDAMDITDTSGGQIIQIDDVFSDNMGLSDTAGVTLSRPVSDSIGLTDTVTALKSLNVTQTDNLGVTDSLAIEFQDVNSDNIGLTDTTSVGVGRGVSASDDLGLTDSMVVDATKSQTDNLGTTDNVAPVLTKPFSDNLGLTDSLAVTSTAGYTDNMGLTDSLIFSYSSVINDPVSLQDSVQANATGNAALTVSDNLGLSDSISVTGSTIRSQTDSLGLTDSTGMEISTSAPTDSLGVTDTVQTALVTSPTVTDTDYLSDSIQVSITSPKSDSLGLTDAIQVEKQVSVTDVIGLTDTAALGNTKGITDNFGLSDTMIVEATGSIVDVLGMTDSVDIFYIHPVVYPFTYNEALRITDSIDVFHLQSALVPPYFTSGNPRVYVTDGTFPAAPTNG
jgi:hypothetical protein